jgi:hypothetical protein
MTIQFTQSAYDRVAALFDAALSPREEISFADWLPNNIKLVDGPMPASSGPPPARRT